MPRTRSAKSRADSPSQLAWVLPESEVATSSGFQPPAEDPVFVEEDEPRPEAGGQVQSAAFPATAEASDFKYGTQLGFSNAHHKITPREKSGGPLS